MRRRDAGIVGTMMIVLAACMDRATDVSLPISPSTKTVILLFAKPSDTTAYAFSTDPRAVKEARSIALGNGDVDTLALAFDRTLYELRLEAGPLEPMRMEDGGRPLPAFDGAFERVLGAHASQMWHPIPSLPDSVRAFTFAPVDLARCAKSGGCSTPDALDGICSTPCPTEDAPRSPQPPAAPTMPHPPQFLPCPVGWMPVIPTGATSSVCDPPKLPPAIGDACGTGDYATKLQAIGGARIVYVKSGSASQAPTGSLSAPFPTIQQAIASVSGQSATIAIARGRYTEDLSIPAGLTLIGACATDTLVKSTQDVTFGPSGQVQIENLTIDTPGRMVIAPGTLSVYLDGVELAGAQLAAIDVEAGHLVAQDLSIRDGPGTAVFVQTGGDARISNLTVARMATGVHVTASSLTLQKADLEDVFTNGVVIDGAGTASIADMVQKANAISGDGGDRSGIILRQDSTLSLSRARIEIHRQAISISQAGGQATIADLYIENPGQDVSIYANAGALDLARAEIDGAAYRGLWLSRAVADPPNEVHLQDIVVENVSGRVVEGSTPPSGLAIEGGHSYQLDRIAIDQIQATGLRVALVDRVRIADLSIKDTGVASTNSVQQGAAALSIDSAAVELAHAQIANSRALGLGLEASATTTATISDLDIMHSATIGLEVGTDASLKASRVRITGSGEVSMIANRADRFLVEDLEVDLGSADGIVLNKTRSASISRARVSDIHGNAIQVGRPEPVRGMVQLSDIEVARVFRKGTSMAAGLDVDQGGARLERFLVQESDDYGAVICAHGALDLVEGRIENDRVGAFIVPKGYDEARLIDRVHYAVQEGAIQTEGDEEGLTCSP